MESRLPKPSRLLKPSGIAKQMTNATSISRAKILSNLRTADKLPLSRDLINFPNNNHLIPRRAASPEFGSNVINRTKLRRSRSACDIRKDLHIKPSLKRNDTTLAPIPSKTSKYNSSSSSSICSDLGKGKFNSSSSGAKNNVTKKPITNTAAAKTMAKRIPPYDYKARFNDLLEKHKVIKEKFEHANEQLSQLDNLPEQFEECQNELFNAKQEIKNLKSERDCLSEQNKLQNVKIEVLAKTLHATKEELDEQKENYSKLKDEHKSIQSEVKELREKCEFLTAEVETLTVDITECKEQLFNSNMERKDLHNEVMDLRGNIRVFCRVRPPLLTEEDRQLCSWTYIDDQSLEICNNDLLTTGQKNRSAKHDFSFDHVFHPKSTQSDIFEMVSPLIQSALDGYNVCIFAYGQTGSGKTYTMDGLSDNLGVIPRTVDLLFDSIKNYKRLGWEYEIRVTFLEIYNEVLYDLLSNENKEMEIRMVSAKNKNDIYVSNVTEEVVSTAGQLKNLLQLSRMNRATAATVGNERSSRSHAVTRIQLIGFHDEKNETCIGTINLVDLAGSESPKTSTRMEETKKINRSLSELTNVILALLQKQEHIPYRNSKLTHLLMPSLGGNSKTLMFINVSPFQDCYVESVKSLRFAASVNLCKLSKAKKNKFFNTSGTM